MTTVHKFVCETVLHRVKTKEDSWGGESSLGTYIASRALDDTFNYSSRAIFIYFQVHILIIRIDTILHLLFIKAFLPMPDDLLYTKV